MTISAAGAGHCVCMVLPPSRPRVAGALLVGGALLLAPGSQGCQAVEFCDVPAAGAAPVGSWGGPDGGLWIRQDGTAYVHLVDGCMEGHVVLDPPIEIDPVTGVALVVVVPEDGTRGSGRSTAESRVLTLEFGCDEVTISPDDGPAFTAVADVVLPAGTLCVAPP